MCTEASQTGEYEDRTDWLKASDVFQICQAFVDDGDEEENFVVVYLKTTPEKVPHEFALEVARMADTTLESLVPSNVAAKFQGAPLSEIGKNRSKSLTSNHCCAPAVEESCADVDHDLPLNYKEVGEVYYFCDDRRYSACVCRCCKKAFASDRNKAVAKKSGKKKEKLIPLPNAATPAFACAKFEAGRSSCGQIFCKGCYIKQLSSTSQGRSRRSLPMSRRSSSGSAGKENDGPARKRSRR